MKKDTILLITVLSFVLIHHAEGFADFKKNSF